MYTISAKLTFHIPHSTSLKDKRQVCRSLIDKTRQKFNVTIAEVDTQDSHKTLTIGIAVVSGDIGHTKNSMDEIVRYMDGNTEAELTSELITEAEKI
ncbi:MAG: DUF503 domain-containing protein [Oscillospiraceae bacterium]|nr:DUF503 domain-containing protein [Oscillospiraceae bacterium]